MNYFYRHFIPIKGFAANCVLLSLARTVTLIAMGGEKEEGRQRSCCGILGTTRGSGGEEEECQESPNVSMVLVEVSFSVGYAFRTQEMEMKCD